MLQISDLIFYVLALASFVFGAAVVLVSNPIYSALFLALTMLAVGGIFVTLDAMFVAAVQVVVYAGAVMVLFVMVLMLFDIKKELSAFSKGLIATILKLLATGMILGLVMGTIWYSAEAIFAPTGTQATFQGDVTKELATSLFTKYLFGFEAIGFLLLMVAIGAVTLSRISGGTHDS